MSEQQASEGHARWSVWFYKPGQWLGWPIYFGSAEGCTRTLLIGTRWTGCIVFGLWRMRFDPDCPECAITRPTPPESSAR
jgi:hypothetical protein